MTPQRVRRMETSRLELTSLSQEAAAEAMGLGESDRSRLRQALTDFRDATLLKIERPDAGARADLEPYAKRQREILGEQRYGEFSRLERQEREKLIAGRRAFRQAAAPARPGR